MSLPPRGSLAGLTQWSPLPPPPKAYVGACTLPEIVHNNPAPVPVGKGEGVVYLFDFNVPTLGCCGIPSLLYCIGRYCLNGLRQNLHRLNIALAVGYQGNAIKCTFTKRQLIYLNINNYTIKSRKMQCFSEFSNIISNRVNSLQKYTITNK